VESDRLDHAARVDVIVPNHIGGVKRVLLFFRCDRCPVVLPTKECSGNKEGVVIKAVAEGLLCGVGNEKWSADSSWLG
jgi:hypothetical protein